jgi:aminopeptidase-like protein
LYLPGCTTDEVLFSAHVCHPSLANDNLSGIAVATWLAQHVAAIANRRYSYRFLFLPVTIGAITWLARNEQTAQRIKHGLVLSLLGDPGKMHYKRSRQGNALVDRAAAHVLEQSGEDFGLLEFEPYGYDERQFCSPGFNLPVGCLTRTPYGRYPQYHTSADNLDLVQPAALADSLACCTSIVEILEQDGRYLNTNPKCEPQLGRRGLYRALGGELDGAGLEKAMLWVLNLSDGDHTLLDIAQRSQLPFRRVQRAAELLLKHALLREADPQ